MWPNCINNLSPVEYPLEGKLPKWVRQQFKKKGVFNEDEMLNIIHPIAILGTCSTAAYIECPNIPEHHIENAKMCDYYNLDDIGLYYWFDFDLIGADGNKIELRMVFNEGDGDCNDGFWGELWERNTKELVADILSTGDCETTINAVSEKYINKYKPHKIEIPNVYWDKKAIIIYNWGTETRFILVVI